MSAANSYLVGTDVILTYTVTNTATGALTNVTNVSLIIVTPDGVSHAYSPSNPSVGVYTYQFLTTMSGNHSYRFASTTPTPGAKEGNFYINASVVI